MVLWQKLPETHWKPKKTPRISPVLPLGDLATALIPYLKQERGAWE